MSRRATASTIRSDAVLGPALALVMLSIASLGLVTVVDDAAYALVVGRSVGATLPPRGLAWLIEARIASCLVCAMLFVLVRRWTVEIHPPAASWRSAGVVAAGWLIGTIVAVVGLGVWVPELPRSVDVAAFLGFGLLAEELLFRGALFAIAARVFPSRALPPIVWTAVLFSVQHLQYHRYHLGAHAAIQLGYTLPMGIGLGYIRWATQRLWPSTGVHLLGNAIAVMHGGVGA